MSAEADGLTPTEAELVALLELLRAEGIEPTEALAGAVMRTVRWQVLLRGTIAVIDDLVSSMSTAVELFAAGRPEERE